MRRLFVGAAGGLVVGVGSAVGSVGGLWGWMGVFHISQWSACHSGWDSVLGSAVSVSSGAVGRMRHRCGRGVLRRGGQVGSEWSWSHRQQMQKSRDSMRLWVSL